MVLATPNPNDVKGVKRVLELLGYSPGIVNGEIEGSTKTAIRQAMAELCKVLNHEKPESQHIKMPDVYTPEFGALLLTKLQSLKNENDGHNVAAMRAYKEGNGYDPGFPFGVGSKTYAELNKAFKDRGLSPQLIANMKGVVYVLDNDLAFVGMMNRIAPALAEQQPAGPPPPATQKQPPQPAQAPQSKVVEQSQGAAVDVRKAQELMNKLKELVTDSGIDLGVSGPNKDGVDGSPRGKTKASVKASQKILGVAETGEITQEFITALDEKVKALSPDKLVAEGADTFNPDDPLGTGGSVSSGASGPASRRRAGPPQMTDVQKNLALWVVNKSSPEFSQFIDQLMRLFTGYGLKDLLPADKVPAGLDSELPANMTASLKQLYTEAHKDGAKPEDVRKEILRSVEGMMQLSFGNEDRQKAFKNRVEDALNAAQNALGTPPNTENAAAAFAGKLAEHMKNFDRDFPNSTYTATPSYGLTDYKVDRSQYNFSVENAKFNIEAVSKAYVDRNINSLRGGEKSLLFKDTDGKTYIAGVERASGLFTVMEITKEEQAKLQGIIDEAEKSGMDFTDHYKCQALMEKLKASSDVFRFAYKNYGVSQFGDFGRGFLKQVSEATLFSGLSADIDVRVKQTKERAERLARDPNAPEISPHTGLELSKHAPGTQAVKFSAPPASMIEKEARDRSLHQLAGGPNVVTDGQGNKRVLYQDLSVYNDLDQIRSMVESATERMKDPNMSAAERESLTQKNIERGAYIDKMVSERLYLSAEYPAEELARFQKEYVDPLKKDPAMSAGAETHYMRNRINPSANRGFEAEFPQLAAMARHYPQFRNNLPALAQAMLRDDAEKVGLTTNFNTQSGAAAAKAAPAVDVKADGKGPDGMRICIQQFEENSGDVAQKPGVGGAEGGESPAQRKQPGFAACP